LARCRDDASGVGFAHRLETMESRLWDRAMFAKDPSGNK
jgi:hypothetical protein